MIKVNAKLLCQTDIASEQQALNGRLIRKTNINSATDFII